MGDDCRIMTSKVPEFDSHININTNSPIKRFLFNERERFNYAITDNDVFLIKSGKNLDLLYSSDRKISAAHITLNGTKIVIFLEQGASTETEVVLLDLFGTRNKKSIFLKTSSIVRSALTTADGTFLITGEAFRVTI